MGQKKKMSADHQAGVGGPGGQCEGSPSDNSTPQQPIPNQQLERLQLAEERDAGATTSHPAAGAPGLASSAAAGGPPPSHLRLQPARFAPPALPNTLHLRLGNLLVQREIFASRDLTHRQLAEVIASKMEWAVERVRYRWDYDWPWVHPLDPAHCDNPVFINQIGIAL